MMIYTKVIYFSVLCILGVSAQDNNDEVRKNKTDSKTVTKLSKVSEFFIADLLRTAEKDQVKSSSINKPIATTPEYVHAGLLTAMPDESRLITNYQIQDHGNSDEESLPFTQSRGNFHDHPTQRGGNAPVNVYEKFLIQQAGILERNVLSTEGVQPISPRYSHTDDRSHHKKEDCKKHSHPVASSEEIYDRSHYQSDRPTSPVEDYRNSPSTYYHNYDHDDSHQVDSHGSTATSYPSRSKSYASEHDSNSKSHSADSYTRSKSSSSSKTVAPKNKEAKVHVFSSTGSQNNKREYHRGPQYEEGEAYKTRDVPQRDAPHSDGRPVRYTNSPVDEAPVTQYHQEYPPQAPRKHSQNSRGRPSAHPVQKPVYDDRPVRYESPYEASKEPHAPEYDSREIYNAPHPQAYQTPQEAPGSDGRPREQHYGTSSPAGAYNAKQPSKPRRKHQPTPINYREPVDNSNQYSHPPQQQGQNFRLRNERPQHQYNSYGAEGPRGSAPNYERNPRTSKSPERKPQGYGYNQPPHGNGEQYQAGRPHESRSSAQYTKPAQTQGRNSGSIGAPVPQGLITKESKPQESRSVSYSESTYNMDEPVRSKSMSILVGPEARNYETPQKMVNPLHRETGDLKARGQSFQSSYKPYNSEYPATYKNDQYYHDSHSAEDSASHEEGPHRPYENHEEYDDGPSHKGGSTKTKSDITGYKDHYDSHEPLDLDEKFFQKYGISQQAKIIVATPMKPNLFVADGTNLKEGEMGEGPRDENYQDEEDEQPYERRPVKQQPYEEDPYREAPQSFRPQDIPGSFTELVGSNSKFLRSVPFEARKENEEVDGYDPSLDELVFRSGVGDPKKFVSSQGGRQIVQMHGDGISKIIFNHAASEKKEQFERKDASEKLQAEKSEIVEVKVKEDEKVVAPQ